MDDRIVFDAFPDSLKDWFNQFCSAMENSNQSSFVDVVTFGNHPIWHQISKCLVDQIGRNEINIGIHFEINRFIFGIPAAGGFRYGGVFSNLIGFFLLEIRPPVSLMTGNCSSFFLLIFFAGVCFCNLAGTGCAEPIRVLGSLADVQLFLQYFKLFKASESCSNNLRFSSRVSSRVGWFSVNFSIRFCSSKDRCISSLNRSSNSFRCARSLKNCSLASFSSAAACNFSRSAACSAN